MGKTEPDQTAQTNVKEFTVSELSFALKGVVEQSFSHVRVRGELGRISRPASGHIYLDLKDEKSVLAGIIWRGQASKLKIQPEQGLEVIVTGRLTTYPGQSRYQIVIDSMEPAGAGALMALLEERKKKLAAEGLFDEERKRPVPFLPRVIGVVTSPTGAVIRDMMHGFEERFPVHVIVWPVRVQGETCSREVTDAIRGFNRLGADSVVPRPDVLIVARGGGSLEDLWGFNEETVARAAAESQIPLISAVGHETDWTLIDLVADARAPTPTKAAEWSVPKYSDLFERLLDLGNRMRLIMRRLLEAGRTRFQGLARGLPRPADIIALPRQRFDTASGRLGQSLRSSAQTHRLRYLRLSSTLQPSLLKHRLVTRSQSFKTLQLRSSQAYRQYMQKRRSGFETVAGALRPKLMSHPVQNMRDRLTVYSDRIGQAFKNGVQSRRHFLDEQSKLLNTLGYQSVLSRGYAFVRSSKGQTVRSAASVSKGQDLNIQFFDGDVDVTAKDVHPDDLRKSGESRNRKGSGPKFNGDEASKLQKNNKQKVGNQGTLF